MTKQKEPETIPPKDLRQPAPNVIDQRQQQIDPAGQHRVDTNESAKHSSKQPGRIEVPKTP